VYNYLNKSSVSTVDAGGAVTSTKEYTFAYPFDVRRMAIIRV
jgi:hypothetical protein